MNNQRNSGLTKALMIETAAGLFARHGFDGVRTQQIASVAGVNAALINYHFNGKLGLYCAVFDHLLADSHIVLAEVCNAEIPILQRFDFYLDSLFGYFTRFPELAPLLVREHLSGAAQIGSGYREKVSQFYLTTSAILGEGEALGIFTEQNHHSFHLQLMGSLTYYLISQPYRELASKAGDELAAAPKTDQFRQQLGATLLRGFVAK